MTRRGLFSAFSTGCLTLALEGQTVPKKTGARLPSKVGEFVAYLDPATENIVVRLTDPAHTSHVPAAQNRHVARRSQLLLLSNDRHGALAPFSLDLRTGTLRQLAETKALKPDTLLFDSTDKSCLFIDGDLLIQVSLERGKAKTLAEGVDDFHMPGSRDEIVVMQKQKLARLESGRLVTLAEDAGSRGIVSPSGNACCFMRETSDADCSLNFVPLDGGSAKELARGKISCPTWNPDGYSVVFLRETISRESPVTELWEAALDGSRARLVTGTSRFATFSMNGNGSVFVGASRSKAQPHVILSLRAVRREMTLCEHKSSRPELVRPVFSANSQRVYFESDRHGKPALYTISVSQLVEATPAS